MGTSLVFPAPKDTSVPEWMEGRLKYLDKPNQSYQGVDSGKTLPFLCYGGRKSLGRVPFLHFKHDLGSNKRRHLIVYFHANSELLTEAYPTLYKYHNILDMDVVAPEYPGYGLYNDEDPSEKMIIEDAWLIIKHCIGVLEYDEKNIILMGRSLGTGVAVQMSTLFPNIKGVILISAFLSVRYVGENVAGRTLSKFLPNVFRNEDFIEAVKAPVLFIHGKKDTLVPWTSSQTLYNKCKAPKAFALSETMDHNKMDFKNDISEPILKFFYEQLRMKEFKMFNEKKDDKLSVLTEMEDFPYAAFRESSTRKTPLTTPRQRIKFLDSAVATAGDEF